jgi:hypothetical protein
MSGRNGIGFDGISEDLGDGIGLVAERASDQPRHRLNFRMVTTSRRSTR